MILKSVTVCHEFHESTLINSRIRGGKIFFNLIICGKKNKTSYHLETRFFYAVLRKAFNSSTDFYRTLYPKNLKNESTYLFFFRKF